MPEVHSDSDPGEDNGSLLEPGPVEEEEMEREVERPLRDMPCPVVPQPNTLALTQNS